MIEKQEDYLIRTNEADVSKLWAHVWFFDAHNFFFIHNCMQFFVCLIHVFWSMYMWAVLYYVTKSTEDCGLFIP